MMIKTPGDDRFPEGLKPSSRTPEFTETSIPAGLLKDHTTAAGYWAKIVVIEGELIYVIQSDPENPVRLSADNHGVVEPGVLHHVRPVGKVRFYVQFYH